MIVFDDDDDDDDDDDNDIDDANADGIDDEYINDYDDDDDDDYDVDVDDNNKLQCISLFTNLFFIYRLQGYWHWWHCIRGQNHMIDTLKQFHLW